MSDEQVTQQFPPIKDVIVILLLTLALTFFVTLFGGLLGLKTGLFLVEGVIILPALIYSFYFKYPLTSVFRLRKVTLPVMGVSVVLGIGLSVIVDEFDRLFQLLLPMPEILKKLMEESLQINSTTDLAIIGFSAVILAAILEEMLFRGFVQNSFEQTFDVTRAVMTTAIIFAITHLNPWWTVQFTLFGIFLGVMAWKSNSIIPPMIVHFMNNAIALIFSNVPEENLRWYASDTHVQIPVVIVAIAITYFGMRFFYIFCDKMKSDGVSDDEL